jgi:hypothetical protein
MDSVTAWQFVPPLICVVAFAINVRMWLRYRALVRAVPSAKSPIEMEVKCDTKRAEEAIGALSASIATFDGIANERLNRLALRLQNVKALLSTAEAVQPLAVSVPWADAHKTPKRKAKKPTAKARP